MSGFGDQWLKKKKCIQAGNTLNEEGVCTRTTGEKYDSTEVINIFLRNSFTILFLNIHNKLKFSVD